MTIQRATAELLALAEAARGEDWAGELALAVAAATNANWEWPRIGLFACRLIFTEEGHPRDLTEAARKPAHRTAASQPTPEWAAARKALAERATAPECRCGCGRPSHRAGLASSCYRRWLSAGRPEVVPPPAHRGNDGHRADRLEDYAELRAWGESIGSAAARLGVCRRTADRYESQLRNRERAAA